MNKRRIYRQGNSIVVSLPPALLSDLDICPGDYVHIYSQPAGNLVLIPIHQINGQWKAGNPRRSDQLGQPRKYDC